MLVLITMLSVLIYRLAWIYNRGDRLPATTALGHEVLLLTVLLVNWTSTLLLLILESTHFRSIVRAVPIVIYPKILRWLARVWVKCLPLLVVFYRHRSLTKGAFAENWWLYGGCKLGGFGCVALS